MKKQNQKIFFSFIVALISIFAFSGSRAQAANGVLSGYFTGFSDDGAGNPSYVDYISLNSADPGIPNGGYSWAVSIPSSDGLLAGSGTAAFSGGLGSYVAFDNSGGYLPPGACPISDPTYGCGAFRQGNNIKGWARFVSIAQAQAVGNSGGWDGWIHLDGITITNTSPTTASLSGYFYAGDQGWIDASGATVNFLPAPTATLTPNLTTIDVAVTPLPQTVTLTWSSSDATQCSASSTSGTWNAVNMGTLGTHDVIVPSGGMNEQFTVTCSGPGGSTNSAPALISTVCYPKVCSSQTCGNDASNPIYGASNASVCSAMPPSMCSSNTDCMARNISGWKEVAP